MLVAFIIRLTFVTPAPRKTPSKTKTQISGTCENPTAMRYIAEIRTTSSSSRKIRESGTQKIAIITPKIPIITLEICKMVLLKSCARVILFAPRFCPVRAIAATIKPKPGIKENASILEPIWLPAIAMSPKFARNFVVKTKDPKVSARSIPDGMPICMAFLRYCQAIVKVCVKNRPLLYTSHSKIISSKNVVSTFASPAPMMSSPIPKIHIPPKDFKWNLKNQKKVDKNTKASRKNPHQKYA